MGLKVIVYGKPLENLPQPPKDSPFSRRSNSLKVIVYGVKGDSLLTNYHLFDRLYQKYLMERPLYEQLSSNQRSH